jgi:hypothetical protein
MKRRPQSGATIGTEALEGVYLRRSSMKVCGHLLLLATVLGFSAAPALAQVTPGDPAGNQTIPEKDRSRPQDMPKGKQDMPKGKKDGVITPPADVDPGISKPAPVPEPNSTPVIPPPGTPGGPPGPEPK